MLQVTLVNNNQREYIDLRNSGETTIVPSADITISDAPVADGSKGVIAIGGSSVVVRNRDGLHVKGVAGTLISVYKGALSYSASGGSLPSGTATEATQLLNNSELIAINTELDTQTVALNTIATNTIKGLLEQTQEQSDYVQTINWLDQGTVDERVDTIVHSSVILGSTVTETFTYIGVAGAYSVSTITLS